MSNPEFREIARLPDYKFGNDGSAWSRRPIGRPAKHRDSSENEWRELRGTLMRTGYLTVAIRENGKQIKLYVHQLILEAFVSPRPPGMDACHINGIRSDNRPENLRWDTHRGNMSDMIKHGTANRGERCPFARLNSEKVIEIRRIAGQGVDHREIAGRFGVSIRTVSDVIERTWKHVPQEQAASE